MDLVRPRLPKGMRDILPSQMVLREQVLGIVEQAFAEFGFEPLITPAVERTEVLLGKGGSEAEKLIYMVQHPGGKEEVALRYDLTVPLGRVVAQYPELPKPFRRYQIAPVWRAERPQRGRYREFFQCDADIVGSSSMLADAEVIALVYTVLCRLGFQQFVTVINDRKILTGIGQYSGVPQDKVSGLHRAIDKLDKLGMEGVRKELQKDGLDAATSDRLLRLLRPDGGKVDLDALRRELADYPIALEGIDELQELLGYLPALGVEERCYRLDLSMVRGLDYYTGPIYETLVEKPKIGSLTGGGRYDGLVGRFSAQGYPATGTTIGLERIFDVLAQQATFSTDLTTVEVLVTVFEPDLLGESLRLLSDLRANGTCCELYYDPEPLGAQIRYALKKGIPLVAILGPDEVAAGQVAVRELEHKSQTSVPRSEVVDFVRSVLDRRE